MSKEIRHEKTTTRNKPYGFFFVLSCFRGYWALIAVAAFATVLAGTPFAAPTLPHLRGIGEVREWFNAGKGHVRLVLLLSPT